MSREIRLNAFDMNCVGHQSPGLWAHPRDRSWQYKDLEYWTDLAKILERGKFDGLFIADVLGIYDVYNGNGDAAIRQAAQVPVNDPLQLIPPMALVTEHLGFGLTASLSFEHPYPFARRLSTLDHLTKGRAGWNIVTSYLESGAKNIGQHAQTEHDARYDYAEEYLQVCYKLWEGSWKDGAVLRDRVRKVFSDPRKIHEIQHFGKHFQVPGIHLCEPSPQRTPVLYQAGASSRGKQFAAEHAECVFVAAPSKVLLKKVVADIRRRAAEAGRDPKSILIFNLQTVIVDETDAKAKAKFEEYKSYVSYEGALALISGWTGIEGSTSASSNRTSRCGMCTPMRSSRRWRRSPRRTRIGSGRPTNWPAGSASAASVRCLSAGRRRWPTCCRSGSRRPMSMASTWRMR